MTADKISSRSLDSTLQPAPLQGAHLAEYNLFNWIKLPLGGHIYHENVVCIESNPADHKSICASGKLVPCVAATVQRHCLSWEEQQEEGRHSLVDKDYVIPYSPLAVV